MEVMKELFGQDITVAKLIAYGIMALLGFVLSWGLHLMKSKMKYGSRFNLANYLQKNAFRVLLSPIVVFSALVLSESAVGLPIGNQSAFIIGFAFDKIIENINSMRESVKGRTP